MDAIKIFDERFKPLNSYYALGCRVIKYIFSFFGIFSLIIIPIDPDDMYISFYGFFSICYCIIMHIEPYLFMKKDKLPASIFKCMKDAPIDRKAFIACRQRLLYNYVTKLAIVSIIARTLCIFIPHNNMSPSQIILSYVLIILSIIIGAAFATFNIYRSTRY